MGGRRREAEAADVCVCDPEEPEPDWPVYQPAGGLNSLGLFVGPKSVQFFSLTCQMFFQMMNRGFMSSWA